MEKGFYADIFKRKSFHLFRIDLGIFLCILELCMAHNNIDFKRTLFIDDGEDREYTKAAEYRIVASKV